MSKGFVFDINEFAVHDGPGIRTSVFLKGCPLRCRWCHNPEGLGFGQEIMRGTNGCLKCGACVKACHDPEDCVLCGECVRACPRNLRRFAATEYTDEQLAARILGNQDFLLKYGGVTFSGGEPLAQPDFLFDVMSGIKPLDIAVETSGYACPEVFGEMLKLADLVLLDIKHIDDKIHKEYTGVSNEPVMRSLEMLQQSGMPFEIRVPVIPGVNDGIDNIRATAALVKDSKALVRVELLAYHRTAGAKYGLVDREFTFRYDQEPTDISVLAAIVESEGVPVFVP